MHFKYDGGEVAVAIQTQEGRSITYLSAPVNCEPCPLTFTELWDGEKLIGSVKWTGSHTIMTGDQLRLKFSCR